MLDKIGNFVKKHPWLVIFLILLITLGFGSLLPSLEMKTTMEDFLPEDEIVSSQERIEEYFGAGTEILMILAEEENAYGVLAPDSLREIDYVGRELKTEDHVVEVISVSALLENICQIEYAKSLSNCTADEINQALTDLMVEPEYEKIQYLGKDDENQEIDYNPYPRLTKGKSIDSLDLKNYFIETTENNIIFSLETYDLSCFKDEINAPHRNINVFEYFIRFRNQIIPDENLDIEYKIVAHIEPESEKWEIGRGLVNNIKELFSKIRSKELNTYTIEPYLWLKPPSSDISFPIKLNSSEIVIKSDENIIEIIVDKAELGKYGLAPESDGFGLPAKIYNTNAGIRYYQFQNFKSPWKQTTISIDFIKQLIENIQKRPLLSGITEKIISKFSDFSYEDFDELFLQLEESGFEIDKISLKDMESNWVNSDFVQGDYYKPIYLKPSFFSGMKKSVKTFLSGDFDNKNYASSALIMVSIDGSLNSEELSDVSKKIVEKLKTLDSENDFVKFRATGNPVIEYEINEVTMDANQIVIPLIFVVISIILFISFWKSSYVFIPLIGLSIAIIWLFGTMVLLGMSFMIMKVALIPMLMGLGVDYSVHLFHNYRAELGKGIKPSEAIVNSIRDIGLAMFLAIITTFIAFLSFLTATMIPLRDFGVLCGIGIAYIFIITITFQAALRYILDRKKELKKVQTKKDPNGKVMRKLAKIVCIHPKKFIITTFIITIIMVIGAMNIQTGFDMNDFLSEENASVKTMNEIMDSFPYASQEKEYILIEGNVATVKTLEGMKNTYENTKNDQYVLINPDGNPKVISIYSIINKAIENNNTLSTKFNIDNRGIPKTNQDVFDIYNYLYQSSTYNREVKEVLYKKGNSYDAALMTVYTNLGSGDDINKVIGEMYNELKEDASGNFKGKEVIVTGQNSMMFSIMNSMTESQIVSTMICIVIAAIVLIIAYRKITLGLITMIPVLISTVWIIGTMYFIGYNLNIMTIMITTLTIGLGITYAIHAVERFRLVADKTGDVIGAVSETIGHTGGALMISAVTTIAGFSMLILVPMPVEQQFGLITALTILYAFLTSILILPPVLMYWGKWRKKTKGYIISSNKNNRK
jgi:predicted RND superfamily exporter protein